MNLQQELSLNNISIQQLQDEELRNTNVQLDVLRLDKIHPVVTGNKWFKLKYYLQHALENNYKTITTFGGAFSNHILATAYACNKLNIPCIGYIRGEKPKQYSQTLLDAEALNMQLHFLTRSDYSGKELIINNNPGLYFIPEGGYGKIGAEGAAEILQLIPHLSEYNYIICACGTGAMLAGITNASLPHQQCIGISVMKNNVSLENEVRFLLNDNAVGRCKLLHEYHFGGYAKYTDVLLDFMHKIFITNKLPLDFVYTAKTFYALYDLIEKKYFDPESKILFIHSGGLQGNRSLQNKILIS